MSDPVNDRGIKGLRRRSREVKSTLLSRRIADYEKQCTTDSQQQQQQQQPRSLVTSNTVSAKRAYPTSASISSNNVNSKATTTTTATATKSADIHTTNTATSTTTATTIKALSPQQKASLALESSTSTEQLEQDSRPESPFSTSSDNASIEEDTDDATIHQLQSGILEAINLESRSRLAGVLAAADPALCLQALLSYSNPNRELKYRHDPDVQNDADELLGRSVANLNALHIACFLGEEELACIVLDYVARVTKSMDARKVLYEFLGRVWGDGNTALHLASFFGMDDLVQRLLKLGANMNKRNDRKYKAVDCADDDATRKLFLEMMQGTVIRIPMRKSVSMDNIFHGESKDKSTTHSTTLSVKPPPNSDKSPRVLYKLPTSARSALTISEETNEVTTTSTNSTTTKDTVHVKHHKSTLLSSSANETRSSAASSASTRQQKPLKCTPLDTNITATSNTSNHSRSESIDAPLSPSKKRTIGRLIEALSTQFRGMSNSSTANEQHINNSSSSSNNITWKHNHLVTKSSKGQHSTKATSSASPILDVSKDTKVDSKLDTHQLSSTSTNTFNSTATSNTSSSGNTMDNTIKHTATTIDMIDTVASPSITQSKQRKSLRVRFDPAAVLLDAARYGDIGLMRHCLEAGISPDYQSVHRRMGAIHMAASYDHLDACRLLVDTGANPNLQDAEGWTPLHCAAAEGHLRVVTFLLGHDAVDTTLMNGDEETAEDVAEEERVRSVLHASILNATRSS
ncbi:hypothetical protein BDF22DRAFT_745844 [Syncephalis plumigaleata]|nr:hypothetical protein BDF22DRAFT_745844 [Syncephalis plumigaleata]